MSQQRRMSTTNIIQFKYANTVPTVLCTSNGLICDYTTGIHDKRIVTLRIMWNLQRFIFYGNCLTYYLLIVLWNYMQPIIHNLCYIMVLLNYNFISPWVITRGTTRKICCIPITCLCGPCLLIVCNVHVSWKHTHGSTQVEVHTWKDMYETKHLCTDT